jgi:hypothetical protein
LNNFRPLDDNIFDRGCAFDIRRALSESDGKDSATDAATMDDEEEEEERHLQDVGNRAIENYTVFLPTNAAFQRISGFDLTEYLRLNRNNRRNLLHEITGFHILPDRAIPVGNLGCGRNYPMLNGINSLTECRSTRKFQVGLGNRKFDGDCRRFNVPIVIAQMINVVASNHTRK